MPSLLHIARLLLADVTSTAAKRAQRARRTGALGLRSADTPQTAAAGGRRRIAGCRRYGPRPQPARRGRQAAGRAPQKAGGRPETARTARRRRRRWAYYDLMAIGLIEGLQAARARGSGAPGRQRRRQQAAGCDCRPRAVDHGRQAASSRRQAASSRPQAAGRATRAVGSRPKTADRTPQTRALGRRRQTGGAPAGRTPHAVDHGRQAADARRGLHAAGPGRVGPDA